MYSSKIDTDSAIKRACELGSKNVLIDVASDIRSDISDAYNHTTDMRWPPVIQELITNNSDVIPCKLDKFLTYIISGHNMILLQQGSIDENLYSIHNCYF